MRYSLLAAALSSLLLLAAPWIAGAQERQLTPQQERMKSCNARANDQHMKGDARRDYMSECLKGENDLTAQQEKMVSCNRSASARNLKGDERRAYMSDCLSAKHEGGSSAAGGR